LVVLGLLGCLAFGCATSSDNDAASGSADLVGGQADLRWDAAGYLAKGASMETLDRTVPACGATLIAPNVVVTAAHCVADEGATFAFGAGNMGGPVVRVAERHPHPDFHAASEGPVDIAHALRLHDVAYLVLEESVEFAKPAALPNAAPSIGCSIQAIGYRPTSGSAVRASTPACVMLQVELSDPIFEVHPQGDGALCVAQGDEGSAVVSRDASGVTLVGLFAGSVTQGLTDCVAGTQFLDGYESVFGYGDFLRAGIAGAARR
jgi:hypothetical protein